MHALRQDRLIISGVIVLGWMASVTPALADPALDRASCIAASERGQRLKLAHRLREARAELLACVRDVCPSVVRRDCDEELVSVEESTPTIVLRAVDESQHDVMDVRATVDGAPLADRLDGRPLSVDPGVHRLRFEALSRTPVEVDVLVVEGEKNRKVTVTLMPAPPPPQRGAPAEASAPVSAFILGGVAVAALGVATYFGISALDGRSTLRDGCGVNRACSDDAASAVKRDALVADLALVSAALAGGAAAWLFLSPRSATPRVAVGATSAGAYGLVQTTF